MSFLQLLTSEPLLFFVLFIGFLFALSVHEMAHAWVGKLLGDRTAEEQGRLTINPLAHIDPFGLLLLVVGGFGYAKPVPYNPYRLKNAKWGPVLIALAGPGSNLILSFISAFVYIMTKEYLGTNNLLALFTYLFASVNIGLALFNIVPLPPLDGSKIALHLLDRPQTRSAHRWFERNGSYLLLFAILLDVAGIIPVFRWISIVSKAILQFFFQLFG